MKFGDKLKALREEKKITALELSILMNMKSPSGVHRWETNKVRPTKTTIKKVCKLFNLSLDYFKDTDMYDPKLKKERKPKVVAPVIIEPTPIVAPVITEVPTEPEVKYDVSTEFEDYVLAHIRKYKPELFQELWLTMLRAYVDSLPKRPTKL